MNLKKICTYIFATLFCLQSSLAQNPIIQTIHSADPATLVYKDTLFLFTGHDEDKSTWFTMKDWHAYSTTDMVNWTDRGVPLSLKTFAWAGKDAWAAQCIFRDGKFYWYVCANEKARNRMVIGVAVSDQACGPYKDALGKPLVSVSGGDIDPTVFIDKTGQAYLYWGNPDLWYVKLNRDMVSYDQTVGAVKVPLTRESFGPRYHDPKRSTSYEEGPWLYQRKNLYYLAYAAGGVPEHLAYSTSSSPEGPWQYRDTIMRIIKKGGAFTNHPAIVDYMGRSYLFYHNGALPGGGGFDRSICVEEFKFNADGSIPRISPTVGIINAVNNLNPYKRVEAETFAWEQGISITRDDNEGIFVSAIDQGDYIKIRNVDFKNGARLFKAIVAPINGGSLEVHLDSPQGTLLGSGSIEGNGTPGSWQTLSFQLSKVRDVHDVYLVFTGGKDNLFNFNSWQLIK